MSNLKLCPFCGGKARMQSEYDIDGFGNFHYIECDDCGAESKRHFATSGNECPQYFSEVREDWNMRADGWISVDDRLPEKYSWYLIVSSTKVTMAFYDGDTVNEDGGLWLVHNDNPDSDEWENVTHWMPLPEPPEAKS